jgi:hypothetical protein
MLPFPSIAVIRWSALLLVAGVLCGWLVSRNEVSHEVGSREVRIEAGEERSSRLAVRAEETLPPQELLDEAARREGALEGQRTLRFSSVEALEAFLARAGDRVRVMGRMDALSVLRVGFLREDDLRDLLDGQEEMGFIYPVTTPDPRGGMVQDDAVAVGHQLLRWLGLEQLDPQLGAGVKIAILDTGVVPHPAYGEVKNIFLVPGVADFSQWNGHGTAVASLILGNSTAVPGAAPGAQLTSWRMADDQGMSDSWLMAQAIIEAAEAGNQIISISMGSYGDSDVLRDAVSLAQSRGALIIASSGNDGLARSAFPAAYPSVVASVAVDAQNSHLLFSNQATAHALATPGWGVSAAYPGDRVTMFSGTSASAPILAGSIAAVMSAKNLSATQALAQLYRFANEAGPAGVDAFTGSGAVNIGRVLRSDVANVIDVAVASQVITPPKDGKSAQVQVNIQNQGTSAVSQVPLRVQTLSGVTSLMATNMAPGEVKTFTIPLPHAAFQKGAAVSVQSVIESNDAFLWNNQRRHSYRPLAEPE